MVKEKEQTPVVVWDKKAYYLLEKACKRIKKDSLANAEKVRTEILTITKSLAANPEKYPKDKYKRNNPGNYRVFEKYRFRIAYRHTSKEIRILRFRSTDQEPILY